MFWTLIVVSLTLLLTYIMVFDSSASPNDFEDWFWLACLVIVSAKGVLQILLRVQRRRALGRSNRRWEQGLCFRCEYDLRGCVSVSCPECGAFFGTCKHPEPTDLGD